MEIIFKATQLKCSHCGDSCDGSMVMYKGNSFCCDGCKVVYQLIQENNLCEYYSLDTHPGLCPKPSESKWAFLDNAEIEQQLLTCRIGDIAIITFRIPEMHCTSCIYLLENLHKLAWGVVSTEVDFLKKEATVKFQPSAISLRQVVEKMSGLGYSPDISLHDLDKRPKKKAEALSIR
jgi:P-type Cu+ transporter